MTVTRRGLNQTGAKKNVSHLCMSESEGESKSHTSVLCSEYNYGENKNDDNIFYMYTLNMNYIYLFCLIS